MLACWLAFPALLIALACGCGLLVEKVAGVELPGLLVPGVGLAEIILVAGFTTIADEHLRPIWTRVGEGR